MNKTYSSIQNIFPGDWIEFTAPPKGDLVLHLILSLEDRNHSSLEMTILTNKGRVICMLFVSMNYFWIYRHD